MNTGRPEDLANRFEQKAVENLTQAGLDPNGDVPEQGTPEFEQMVNAFEQAMLEVENES